MGRFILLVSFFILAFSSMASAASIMYTLQTAADEIADLDTLKSLNIDVVLNVNTGDVAASHGFTITDMTNVLDALQARNMKGMIALYGWANESPADTASITAVVTALHNHPALYGWYTYDEPTISGITLSDRQSLYNTIKAIDPVHPVLEVYPGYGSGFWPAASGITASPYSDTAHDLFGIDTYPIRDGGYSDMAYSGYATTLAGFTSALNDSKSQLSTADKASRLVGVMQTFGWSASSPMPTATQLTDMAAAWQSTGWNSSGDFSFWMWAMDPSIYSLGEGSTFLKDRSDLWPTVATAAAPYHENLYGPAAPTAARSTATMRASFR